MRTRRCHAWKIANHPSTPNLSFPNGKARLFWRSGLERRAVPTSKKNLWFRVTLPQRTGDMGDIPEAPRPNATRPHYRWPWYVLAGFLLAIILAVVWLSFEIRRTQRIREINTSMPQPVR